MPKPLHLHEIADPTRHHSRAYKFTLPDGETAIMELSIVPRNSSIFKPIIRKPSNSQILQTLNEAARTNIDRFLG